jgi:hypothetical protein
MLESSVQHRSLLCLALYLPGCASIQAEFLARPFDASGHLTQGELTPSGLRVSGGEMEDLASPYLGAIQLVFENRSADWVRIQDVRLRFGTPAQDAAVRVPYGRDLTTWYEATLQRNEVREHNRALVLGLITLGGATVAAASGDERVAAVGGVASLGALTALTVSDVKASIDALERPAIFPETHLLSGPFAVPPSLFVKKWITLGTPGSDTPCVSSMTLSYAIEGRARENVYLRFKVDSEWQAKACGSLLHARGGD